MPQSLTAHPSAPADWVIFLSLSLFVIESLISKCYGPLRRTQIPPTDKWSADAHAPSVEKGEVRFKKRLKNRNDYGTVCVVFPSLPCRRHFIKLINNRPPFFTPSPSVLAALDATQQKETICLPPPFHFISLFQNAAALLVCFLPPELLILLFRSKTKFLPASGPLDYTGRVGSDRLSLT